MEVLVFGSFLVGSVVAAHAAPCAPVSLPTSREAGAFAAVRLVGGAGEVTLTGGSGDVALSGAACGEARLRLVPRGDVLEARIRGARDAGIVVTLALPASVTAVSVYQHAGPVHVQGVDARVAVIANDGAVSVDGVGDLRVASVHGDVDIRDVRGDVSASDVDGSLRASTVSGDVTAERIAGQVALDAVAGTVRTDPPQS